MQLRPGPNRVGPWGLLQPAADAGKMLFKEDLTPETADPLIYRLAPFISLFAAMATFAVIPVLRVGQRFVGGRRRQRRHPVHLRADRRSASTASRSRGWSSGSKFPLIGSVRSTAQMISYELAMTMSVIGVLILAARPRLRGSSTPRTVSGSSSRSSSASSSTSMTAVAETNRTPFDLVEAESELVAGFHTEYSGLRFGLFFIAEYLNMITVALRRDAALPGRMERAVRAHRHPRHRVVRAEGGLLHFPLYLAARNAFRACATTA